MFLVMSVPVMWIFLTLTTVLFKQDIFFVSTIIKLVILKWFQLIFFKLFQYVSSGIFTCFSGPYMGVGLFMTIKFWKYSKLFYRRVNGKPELEPMCRKLFFAISYMTFDMQITLCACIISMAPSVNQGNLNVLITSVVFAPFFAGATLIWFVVGYFAVSGILVLNILKIIKYTYLHIPIPRFVTRIGF